MSDSYPCGHDRGGDNDQWFKNGSRQSRRCRQCNVNDVNARGKAGRDALRTLQSIPMPSVPAGWVLVPVEPTAEMVMAACVAIEMAEPSDLEPDDPTYLWGCSWMASAREAWSSMLAATPTPPIEGRDADVEKVARALYQRHPTTFYDKVDGNCEMCWLEARERQTSEYRDAVADARAALQALGERP